jgi:hypothetical protein
MVKIYVIKLEILMDDGGSEVVRIRKSLDTHEHVVS